MKKSEVKIGSVYTAMISGKLTNVQIVSEVTARGYGANSRDTTNWMAKNLRTGKEVRIKSAAKLRSEVPATSPEKPVAAPVAKVAPVAPSPAPKLSSVAPVAVGGQHSAPVGASTTDSEEATNGKWKLAEKLRERKSAGIDSAPHLIIEARAGTGKTTTLVEGLKRVQGGTSTLVPSPQQAAVWESMGLSSGKVQSICFVAFNKSIATELQTRMPAGCNAMTLHSMGFKAVKRAFPSAGVNEYRVQDIISEILDKDIRELRKTVPVLIQATEQLVGLCKQNLVAGATEEELERLAGHYDVELNGQRDKVFDLVPKVLQRCKDVSRDGSIDFNDMVWLPVALDLPCYRYDLLLVDEAQDLNRAQQQLALKSGRRLILCGDPKQAIYGFAGADADSMPRMATILGETERGCVTLPLTVTRRCGKAIVEEAKKIVPDFGAFETNPEGSIGNALYEGVGDGAKSYHGYVQDGDMVLCRVNAPLVSQCFRFLKAGRKANIQGRDIGKGLISTINKLKASDVADLIGRIGDWCDGEVRKVNAQKNPSEARLIALQDRKDCLIAFCEDTKTVEDVKAKIESVFSDTNTAGIRLSSIHRAKGLEAKRVFFLLPKGAECPHPMAKSAWQKGQENNLRYVAITRAIEELVYVR